MSSKELQKFSKECEWGSRIFATVFGGTMIFGLGILPNTSHWIGYVIGAVLTLAIAVFPDYKPDHATGMTMD